MISKEQLNLAVVPGGSMGQAIALIAAQKGHNVRVYRRAHEVDTRERVNLPDNVKIFSSLKDTVTGVDVLVLAPPTQIFEELARESLFYLKRESLILSASKGLQKGTNHRPSQILENLDQTLRPRIAVMSGPNLASGILRGDETGTVIAAYNSKVANYLRDRLENPKFIIQAEKDLIGVELGGAFKNLVALAAGMFDEINMSANTKAYYITKLVSELVEVALRQGAKSSTFTGLSWLGDIFLCTTDNESRNYRAGELLVKNPRAAQGFLSEDKPWLAEGVHTIAPAYALARVSNINSTPILDLINNAVYTEQSLEDAINRLGNNRDYHDS